MPVVKLSFGAASPRRIHSLKLSLWDSESEEKESFLGMIILISSAHAREINFVLDNGTEVKAITEANDEGINFFACGT